MFRKDTTYKTNRRAIISSIVMLLFSTFIMRATTTGESKFQDGCFESCLKLLRETIQVDEDQQCPNKTDPLYEERNSCRSNCKEVANDLGNKTVFSRSQHTVEVPRTPLLYNSGYTFLALNWNTSLDESSSVALYILQVQPNLSLHNPLEIPPSVARYIVVKNMNNRNLQNFTVENLVNGFDYKFRVAAIGFNGKSSEYSNWSSWYSTSNVCKRTTGEIETGPFGDGTKEVDFPCPVRRITLNVSIIAGDKKPVVLDASLNWDNPPRIHQLDNVLVKVTVKLRKHQEEKIDAICSHYHDTDFKEDIFLKRNRSQSLHLPSDASYAIGKPRKSIHFGCSYVVKFEVAGATSANSFETTTTFNIPECLKGVKSCPIPKRSHDSNDSGSSVVIEEKVFSIGNSNSSYATNISWNADAWSNFREIEYFHVTLEEWPSSSGGFHHSIDVPAKDGVSVYHVVFYNLSDEKSYRAVVLAYHGVNCVHDSVERKIFQIQRPCSQGCIENATCWPKNSYDGTAVCLCKVGYTGNGTSCSAMEPEPVYGKDKTNINVLPIIIPLASVLALAAVIVALITWRIKRKRELVLNVIEAHESAITSSSSNTNLYQHCPPMQTRYANPLSKVNEVELEEKEVNVIYVPQEIQDAITHGLTDGYEFNAEQIKLEECLGKGAFGYVHRARALGITEEPEWTLVAVKTLSEPVTDKSVEDFIAEIELMKKIGDHENIIQMLGCCTLTMPICLIMEYAPYGNLLTYLRTFKSQILEKDLMKKNSSSEKLEPAESPLSKETGGVEEESTHAKLFHETDDIAGKEITNERQAQLFLENTTYLETFALQIANGMAYVAGRGIVHRDLAARNILIGKDYKLKISDFGLSKEGVYVKSTSGKIPLRWLSIEAIRERIYSSASDVWSFGIVLWEICTLGDFPYPTLSDRELLKFLVNGERLEKPKTCSDAMYAIMLKCWQGIPEDRPTFAHLRNVLWKMDTGENPYINIDPEQEDLALSEDNNEECNTNPTLAQ